MSLHSGQKLYFPNIIFRLIRSNLPPHQALFRIPRNVNKLDVKAYLKSIYDVDVTDVRTANYLSKQHTEWKNRKQQITVKIPAYKRAIVTMKKDFSFPPVPQIGYDGVMPSSSSNNNSYPPKNKDVAGIEYKMQLFTALNKLYRDAEARERGQEVEPEPRKRLGFLAAKRKRIIDLTIRPMRRAIEDQVKVSKKNPENLPEKK